MECCGSARKLYGEIGPAFYGLRTTLVTLLLMALLRIKRPEQLKERDPAAFGRLLGLDRAPEVKTLRRQLRRLAAHHCAEQLGAELARLRVAQRGDLMGFLYVDGHVRAYHGKPISQRLTWRGAISPCPPPPTTGSTTAPASRCSS